MANLTPILVLSVEDQPRIQRCVADMTIQALDPACVVVVMASTSEDAIELLRKFRFDLVISDYQLGDTNGGQIFEYLRSDQPAEIDRFLFFSGSEEAKEMHRTVDKGGRVEEFVSELRKMANEVALPRASCSASRSRSH
jgi:CheY-like chemotaxis protein